MSYLNRHITRRIENALKLSPVVYLNGARQTGKSTLARTIAPQMGTKGQSAEYLSFDKPTLMAAASAAPEAFLTGYDSPIIIDEVQMVPELFRALKVVVDNVRFRDKGTANGKYLLTGSANILALPKLADALVGRAVIMTLYPLTAAEATHNSAGGLERIMTMNFKGINNRGLSLIDAMKKATFPEVSTFNSEERKTWFDSYISTMLQRDVRQIADLEKISVLPHLLSILAARTGGLMNDSKIARDINMNHVSAKSYRNILKLMFLTFDVRPWFRNIGKRLVKTPKGYLIDTPMICHLLDYNIDDIAKTKPELFGHLIENFIATEIVKQLSNSDMYANELNKMNGLLEKDIVTGSGKKTADGKKQKTQLSFCHCSKAM